MAHWFDYTPAGETKGRTSGPYADQAAADAAKAALAAAEPTWTVGAVVEDAGNPADADAQVQMIVFQSGEDQKIWTDGTVETA